MADETLDVGLTRLRHTTTDPACTWHEPPRNSWQRRKFDRARGRVCAICRPDEWARLVDYLTPDNVHHIERPEDYLSPDLLRFLADEKAEEAGRHCATCRCGEG